MTLPDEDAAGSAVSAWRKEDRDAGAAERFDFLWRDLASESGQVERAQLWQLEQHAKRAEGLGLADQRQRSKCAAHRARRQFFEDRSVVSFRRTNPEILDGTVSCEDRCVELVAVGAEDLQDTMTAAVGSQRGGRD